jgi:hypothetical protein
MLMAYRKWWRVIGPLAVALFFFQLYSSSQSRPKAHEAFERYCAKSHLDSTAYKQVGGNYDAFVTSWDFNTDPGLSGLPKAHYRVSVPWIGATKVVFVAQSP